MTLINSLDLLSVTSSFFASRRRQNAIFLKSVLKQLYGYLSLEARPSRGSAERVLAVRFPAARSPTVTDTEILAWLDDHSRLVLRLTAHQRVTARHRPHRASRLPGRRGWARHPAATLTDNGMVFTIACPAAKAAATAHQRRHRRTTPPAQGASSGGRARAAR